MTVAFRFSVVAILLLAVVAAGAFPYGVHARRDFAQNEMFYNEDYAEHGVPSVYEEWEDEDGYPVEFVRDEEEEDINAFEWFKAHDVDELRQAIGACTCERMLVSA